MANGEFGARRAWVAEYFDRTGAAAWAQLTSNEPVGRIRQTVRAGRDRMRATLLGWLPSDLAGVRVLDAGCGPGAMALELAHRGADVLAIDLSPVMVDLARERTRRDPAGRRIEFRVGDMLDPNLGSFQYTVAMDSLIHYEPTDGLTALAVLAERTEQALAVTFAPQTPLLTAMHAAGRFFPRGNRAPAIQPVAARALKRAAATHAALAEWRFARSTRISQGFYTSQAYEVVRKR